ncbi:MAG: AmmeMemoRadiSam system protein B [Provencibacterium sp.]|jgi:AmmeMemoRadiSam system protein B|nr:AmmeMemoRadiSam system protein B [Provencibacterium sp.]
MRKGRLWLCAALLAVLPAGRPLSFAAVQEAPVLSGMEQPVGEGTVQAGSEEEGTADAARRSLLSCAYYEEASFLQSVDGAQPYPAEGRLRAGVVPHHLLAGRMIAAFFARAAQDETHYESVILVGPSHYPVPDRMITAYSGWQTPFGTLENDRTFTRRLVENGRIAAMADEAAMEKDHALAGLIPYVRYYLPDAAVSTVLIQNTAPSSRVEALAGEISAYLREKPALLVCSVDFSHYLMPDAAAERDGQTRRALESYDYAAVSRFTDSNVDSPPALTVFLKNAESYGPVRFFDHGASDTILSLPLTDPIYQDGTTTYFILGAVEE